MKTSINQIFAENTSAFPLAFFRISFGCIMFWDVAMQLYQETLHKYYIEPKYFFHYFDWDFIKPLPAIGMYLLFGLMAMASIGVALGWRYRWNSMALFFLYTYIFLLDQTHYLNHAYLLCLISFIMIFLPATNVLSVDAKNNSSLRKMQVPQAAMFVLQFQIAIVYIFGGIAKLNYDWLHGEPMRMWLSARKDFPMGTYLQGDFFVYFFSYGGLLFDLFIIPLLLWKKTRLPAFAVALVFHFINGLLFDIGIFPVFMIIATLLIFVPEFTAWLEAKFSGYNNKSSVSKTDFLVSRTARALLIVWCGVQLLIPLRHFMYPGNVSWTEEGHKFSWHMKLRSKRAVTKFFVEDIASGKIKEISPDFFLTQKQIRKMAGNPELLAQFCRYMKSNLTLRGIRNVRIKTQTYATLNGRKLQLLVNPETDLASQKYSLLPDKWIVPLMIPLHNQMNFSAEENSLDNLQE